MTKTLMLAAVLLLSAAWLQAQESSQTGSNQSGSASDQASTVQGCLQGSNGNFTLTDDSGNAYQIQGDTAKLADHVGHEVQITGKVTTTTSATATTSPDKGATTSSSSQRGIEVQDIKHVSETCKSANK